MTTQTAGTDHLAELGVRAGTITDAERLALDRDGFVLLAGIVDPHWLARIRAGFEARLGAAHVFGGPSPTTGDVMYDLANHDPAFDRMWSHPRILAAVDHVLGRPFKLSSLNGRDPRRGEGGQALHADWRPERQGAFHVVNSLWMLDDFTPENGATRIVPGSHLAEDGAIRALADPQADHPDQVVVRAPAGSVLVFNAHAWHGGTVNRSGDRRRAMHAYFTAREHPQQLDQRRYVRLRTWERLDAAQRWLLDVDP